MRHVLPLAVLALLAACDTRPSLDTFVKDYCEVLMPCCKAAERPTDGVVCRSRISSAATSATYDPAAGEACLTEFRAASAKADFCSTGMSGPATSACSKVFKTTGGTKMPGETCSEDSDCATPTAGKVECDNTWVNGAERRICQVQKVGKEGDKPCLGTVDGTVTMGTSGSDQPAEGFLCNRADGVYCSGDGKEGCKKVQALGGPCDSQYTCVSTAYCSYSKDQCLARVQTGGSCTESSSACLATDYCDQDQKCATLLAVGAACTSSSSCASHACVNGKCEKNDGLAALTWVLICG
jgi:hypothetical protein